MSKKPLTIGNLTNEIDGSYQRVISHGVEYTVAVHGVNLINYVVGVWNKAC